MAETLREFLVSIGYKVDGNSERRFEDSLKRATLRAELLGRAIAEAAEAIVRGASRIAGAFDEVYYASQRTQSSVQNLKALSYAVSQLGGSYGGTMAAIENFARNLRSNPGYGSMVRMLGVATEQNGKLKDTTQIIRELSKELSRSNKPYYIQKQYFEALGLDEQTYNALKSGELVRYLDEYNKKQQQLGVDQTRAAEIGRDLTRSWRSLNITLAALGEKLMMSVGPALTKFVEKFDDFITNNADKIELFFNKLMEAIQSLVEAFIELVEKGQGPIVDMFDKIGKSIDTLTTILGAFAAFLITKWLVQILGAFTAVGSGFGAMLLRLGINPAMLGLSIAMTPTEGNAGEDEEIARRRATGTFGPANPADLEADAARRSGGGGSRSSGGDSTSSSAPPADNRSWWQRIVPKWAGGQDAPTVQRQSFTGGDRSNARIHQANDNRTWWQRIAPRWAGGRDAPGTGNNLGGDVKASAASIPIQGKALLDTIASTEASSYNVMYGNRKFDSYADHPRQYHTIVSGPNKGQKTSAAGRYQFLVKTWDQQARKLNLKDFSPESQDIAAWDLAKTTYKQKTGEDLETALKSGNPDKIAEVGRVLNRTWTSLPGGPEQGQGSARMNRTFNRAMQRQEQVSQAQVQPTAATSKNDETPATTPSTGESQTQPATTSENGEASTTTPSAGGTQAAPPTPGDEATRPRAAVASGESKATGFKNITGETSFGSVASGALLFNQDSIAGQMVDPKLTKTQGLSGGLGGFASNEPMYQPNSTSTTSISQKNEITVNGASDPTATAAAVENGQKPINASLIRNVQGAVR